jgi:hypothetical protein
MTTFGPYDRGLRAADSDREAVADILREQHVAGRLDSDELQERIERCYRAKTYAELDAVIEDLPGEEPRMRGTWRTWRWPRFALVLPLLIAVVAISHGHLFWLAIPLVFFFFVRPMIWRASAGRSGWGPAGCGPRPGRYL